MAKNTSLPSLFDPLTLALSILIILSNLSYFYLKKHTHIWPSNQLHIYSLAASFSCKTNTRFLFSIFYILVFIKKNLPRYAIRTNQNAAEQNRPGIQTDSMLKKQGRWVQNRIKTWWPKKCMLQRSYFLQSRERLSEDPSPLAQRHC